MQVRSPAHFGKRQDAAIKLDRAVKQDIAVKQDLAVKTVDRVAAILRAMAAHGPGGIGIAEVAEMTSLSKATVHRLLGALANVGFVYQQLPERRYRLGAGAIALGGTALHDHAAAITRRALDRLAQATGDTVFAQVREGPAAICIARAVGSYPVRTLTLDIGDRRPLGVGAGSLALLSALPDAAIAGVVRQNATWLMDYRGFDAAVLAGLVKRTRRAGYALNEGRIVPAMSGIGVAVRGADGQPFASLSIAAIKDRMGKERLVELAGLLQGEARTLEAALAADAPRAAQDQIPPPLPSPLATLAGGGKQKRSVPSLPPRSGGEGQGGGRYGTRPPTSG